MDGDQKQTQSQPQQPKATLPQRPQHTSAVSDPQAKPRPTNNNGNRRYNNNPKGNSQGQGQGQGGQYHNDGQRKGAPNPKRGKKFVPNKPKANEHPPKEVPEDNEKTVVQPVAEVASPGVLWSSIVSQRGPVAVAPEAVQQQAPPPQQTQQQQQQAPPTVQQHPQKSRNRGHANGQKKEYQQKHPKEEVGTEPVSPPKEDYNADAKIEAIQNAVVQQLSEMQTKADRLKSLQEEIRKIKEEKDVEIEGLLNRKTNLSAQQKQLLEDLKSIENEIGQIDTSIEQLKKEKIQKIHVLDEQSRALLSN
eukprot:TRINITY_DN1096_c0_g1_i1.p1 TRINITY_DN1096_c0_g1~~TRINITY_DN1096_c0_g1_i1.p1  ORF type:complete len:305 (-),score=65.80 TRINITY_DN1096_c0_g1_i1:116-1030(-)